ncbi:pantetheine-phosphate adenylyltransferase [Desulfohalotomaculum tongense]|uniref:pantetheine-phosphate adenylyltransferase n=1 Tax=Desulforadius tongensis TaxID=1216062 RepID=UPI00195901F1|nr:pantetheine-phosphate adenylyltransferase [Desulforadius tongensis]MBM7856196.1 pantetheine-phosphate adenylyltransferase [Desulforadius tongensis]
MRIAVYPGSFDPVHYGHIDIIERASALVDKLVVAVAVNPNKKPLFSLEERVEILEEVLKDYSNVYVESFEGLTVNFALKHGAQVVIRGLRAITDFENEFVFALTNKKLAPTTETVYLMTRSEYSFISSTGVKEVAYYGGNVTDMVPSMVAERLLKKYNDSLK